MKRVSCYTSCILLMIGLHGPGASAERFVHANENLIIVYEQPLEFLAKHLEGIYLQVKGDLEGALRWKLEGRPRVLLIGDRKAFEAVSGNRLISAFAAPRGFLVVMNIPSLESHPYLLNETFKHELCHLLLHQHIRETLLPKWLDEGVCQWVSGSFGELMLDPKQGAARVIDLARHAFPLRQLADAFPEEERGLTLAYEESRSFVEYVASRYGNEGLLSILQQLKTGDDVDQAFQKSLSRSVENVEKDWRAHVARRNVWLIWFAQYLYEILFFIAAILTIVAFVRFAVRKKRYIDQAETPETFSPIKDSSDSWPAGHGKE